MKGDRDVYFQSERTGYSQLYTVSYDGGTPKALTSGNWEIDRAELSRDKSRLYLTTSEADAGERQFYEMSADVGARTRITSESGSHSVSLSPDERWVPDVSSYTTKPPQTYLPENPPRP